MAIAKKLEKLLQDNKIKYEVIEHKKVYTAFDAAETQHVKLSEVAKAVLLKGKKGLYFAVLAAGNNSDFKKLSKLIGDKVSLAKEKDIYTKLSAKGGSASGGKTKVGLVAPFGSLFKIPVFVDSKLAKTKKLILPAGSYTESVQINTKDYVKLEEPVLGSFAIKK
jgi:Ala-tRNA(Pro) deacylase